MLKRIAVAALMASLCWSQADYCPRKSGSIQLRFVICSPGWAAIRMRSSAPWGLSKNCSRRIRTTPKPWSGTAPVHFSSRGWMARSDMQRRIALFSKGTSEMNRAVSLEPDSIAVRIPRGGTLRMLAPGMPNFPILTTLIENARSDYQHAFDMQKDQLDSMGTYPLGELLQGLGDLYSRQGKTEEAQKYYIMIQAKLRGTIYAERAEEWMKTRRLAAAGANRLRWLPYRQIIVRRAASRRSA